MVVLFYGFIVLWQFLVSELHQIIEIKTTIKQ
jgi:hypothetical protein